MKLKLLPSSFEADGAASPRQHLTCFLINSKVAVDAGSLAMAATDEERASVRDVVLTHAHLDHIAGLPLYIDDQFSSLTEAIRIHATQEVIDVLERDVFNWSVYPRFSELTNAYGRVVEYLPFTPGSTFTIGELTFEPLEVNHKVPTSGFLVSEGHVSIAISGDTAAMGPFWDAMKKQRVSAVLIECAFPDELAKLAEMSHHLTPASFARELENLSSDDTEVFVINIKPSYRQHVIREIEALQLANVKILEVGRTYEWTAGSLAQIT